MAPKARGTLSFVGLGLNDEDGITTKGLNEIASADLIFAENYTSSLADGSIAKLERRTGKKIVVLDRAGVEDGKVLLDACREKKTVILVAGDPMTATTHIDLRLRAERQGTSTKVVHGSSILTAAPGILGLQHYKFGRTTTVPFPQEGYSPTSPLDVVADNLSRGLHTLVLLDIDSENSRYMTANEGLHILLDMDKRSGKGLIKTDTLACVVSRAGADDCIARAGPIGELMGESYGPPLHTLVIPGKLHFMEEEALEVLAGMKTAKK